MELTDLDIGEEDGSDGFVNFGDKKRRLTFEQVKTLEKSFELGNKLDFDRKMQLAKALGLQPRQVAIWFQNKRARRKTKQLQKDFDALKKDYDALKGKYDILLEENKQFNDEVQRLSSTEPGNNERNGKVWVSEIETQQNSTNSTLEPTNSRTELSSEAEICKTCTEPVRDTYPMTWKEQGSGCSTITNEAESSVFSESPFKIESLQLQGVSLTLANNNSSPLLPEISSVGEQASGALKMAPQSHETRCLTTMQEVSVWLNQDEQTCSNLFHSLEDQSALMLWEYWHIRSE